MNDPELSRQDLYNIKRALDQAAIVAVTDAFGRIIEVNDKFCEISRYARDELIGQDHRVVNSGHHPKAFMTDLWRTISSGQVWRGELLNRTKDGRPYWVDTTIVPFLDERGAPCQYFAIHYDITDRKQAEARLREQATLAQIGEMAAVVAHEVKNPLAGIGGALQLIASDLPDASRGLMAIGQIRERLASVDLMVQDLLFFAHPPPARIVPVAVRDIIAHAVAQFGNSPGLGAATVRQDVADLTVRADAEQVATAVRHLLVNAAHAMRGRGVIDLRAFRTTDECTIAVHDTGPGIPAEVRERVFEPFVTTKSQGRGLGLAIARRVAEQHGGRISIEGPSQGGTMAVLTLPAV